MEGKKPLVTIVTITFNLIKAGREKSFRQCVESIHNQTYENIEHIIIDGASNDGTVDLIKEFADKGWIKYVSEKDEGIYDAMNKGIKLAQGKYIAFLNSDDYYHGRNGVEVSVKALEKSGADFSYAPAIILNEEEGREWVVYPNTMEVFLSYPPFNHQTMFTKRSVMMEEGMFNTEFKIAGDLDFILRIFLKKYKGVAVEEIFTTYRLAGVSSKQATLSESEAVKIIYNHYKNIYPITIEDCWEIRKTRKLPAPLIKKLKQFRPYFDYGDYLNSINFKSKSRLFFLKWYSKWKFMLFSPNKFIKKYFDLLAHSRLRQPARRIYYLVRGKKLK